MAGGTLRCGNAICERERARVCVCVPHAFHQACNESWIYFNAIAFGVYDGLRLFALCSCAIRAFERGRLHAIEPLGRVYVLFMQSLQFIQCFFVVVFVVGL